MNKAMQLIARHEGTRTRAYKDTKGIWTVGVGHNLEAKPIPQAAVDIIFQADYEEVVEQVKASFYWFEGLNTARQAVVIDMVFNMGLRGFSDFKNTIRFLQDGEYAKASVEMLDSKWAKQDVAASRSGGLSYMMKTGEWL